MSTDVFTDQVDSTPGSMHSTPRPRTPSVLDHRMYPHIMDAVFSGVSPSGSLVLRATSREFRDRVDNELWRHIALGPSETGAGISVAAAGGSMPLRVTHCGHTSHANDCQEDAPSTTEIYPALLGRARVVSIRGPVDAYGGSLAWFSSKLTNINTLRLMPPMPRPFTIWPDTVRGAKTVIIFTVMSRGSRHYLSSDGDADEPAMLYKPPFAIIPPVTSTASRLVINVTIHPDDPFISDARIAPVQFTPKLLELVVIFNRSEPADVPPDLGMPGRQLRRPPLGILHPIIYSMLGSRRTKVTIVDALHMGHRALSLDDDLEGADPYEKLLETAAEIFLTQGVGFDPKKPTENLRFMTLDEYRASVDEEEFELEMYE